MNMSEFIKGLTPEQREKAQKCQGFDEILALAKEEKIALPDGVLAAVAGGDGQTPSNCGEVYCDNDGARMEWWSSLGDDAKFKCPKCGAIKIVYWSQD